ncbi:MULTISPECIES: tyrosine-type recombinase/integrase [Gammaproteobacteria]|uniref:tyrosine-type recombinase/integrase n=1 Tax=Gammaproteobacteria TaxID=1236 RepID=UPI001F424E6A|nr:MULTISPECIES: tyrosine-type recombinase/integrase [Gammaproteobacteria]MCF4010563.1 tyrosine-type recombinase/integrase [Rheinheimera sp. UJ63]MDP5036248.1 tyrosine-type recombinase/integrase [Alishewanella sp.]MDP5458540.1 tyrosine-type recombinase/integrase [Alishewanella sp. SMS8]
MASRIPWNKGKIIGQKAPLRQQEIWSIRARLEIANNLKELALFNLAIDSKLRGCDLVALKVSDVMRSGDILTRTSVVQQKTGTPVMFEIITHTRQSLRTWIAHAELSHDDYLFPSRKHTVPHLGTRAYDRLVHKWVRSIGLDSSLYGTHSMRRTKVSILYKRDKNLRAIQLLLGHKKIESTVRYLGIDVQDALEASENLDI